MIVYGVSNFKFHPYIIVFFIMIIHKDKNQHLFIIIFYPYLYNCHMLKFL